MKTRFALQIFLILLFTIGYSCKKRTITSENPLKGVWVKSLTSDTLTFSDEKVIINKIEFKYEIKNDSIEFKYNGDPLIQCIPVTLHYDLMLNNNRLVIRNLNELCLVDGKNEFNVYDRVMD